MPNKPDKQTRPARDGYSPQGEYTKLIFMSCILLVLVALIFGLPGMLGNDADDSSEGGSKRNIDLQQLAAFEWAFPPEPPAAAGAYVEQVDMFAQVEDADIQQIVAVEFEPWDALLHKARVVADSISDEIAEVGIAYAELNTNPASYRGKALRVQGKIKNLITRKLPRTGKAGLDTVYEGVLVDDKQRGYFFSVAEYPLNLYVRDQVVLEGYFLKVHRSSEPDHWDIGPLLLGRKLQLLPAPPMDVMNDSLLEKVVLDDDIDRISKVSYAGWYYLLHKLRLNPEDDLAAARKDVGLQVMLQQPREVRGQAVEVRGIMLATAERIPLAVENESGLQYAYNGFIGNADGELFRFSVIEPPLFKKGDAVILRGYFLQRMSHQDTKNIKIITPMIVGLHLEARPERQQKKNDTILLIVGVLFLGTIALTFILTRREGIISEEYVAEHRKRFRPENLHMKEGGERLRREREASIQHAQDRLRSRLAKKKDAPAEGENISLPGTTSQVEDPSTSPEHPKEDDSEA